MGALASYAGQVFNKYVGFTTVVLSKLSSGYSSFDIYALGRLDDTKDSSIEISYVSNYYIMAI